MEIEGSAVQRHLFSPFLCWWLLTTNGLPQKRVPFFSRATEQVRGDDVVLHLDVPERLGPSPCFSLKGTLTS